MYCIVLRASACLSRTSDKRVQCNCTLNALWRTVDWLDQYKLEQGTNMGFMSLCLQKGNNPMKRLIQQEPTRHGS